MRILIILFILISNITLAQKPWEKFENMDSTEFVEQFGSIEQYNYQKDIERKSSHKLLCLWTGAKAVWLYNFAMYLGTDYNVEWDDQLENQIVIKATPKIYSTAKAPTIKLVAPFNGKEQVLSASITGNADDVIKIFLNYWQLTDISLNDLKAKKAVVKNFVSDKVSFAWTGEQPVIKVEKNGDAPIDLFALK